MTSQKGGLVNSPGPLMKAGLQLMKNVLTTLAKSVLVPLRLISTASVSDAATQKKIFGLGTTTLILSNEDLK